MAPRRPKHVVARRCADQENEMPTDLATRQERKYCYSATDAQLRRALRDLARYSAAYKNHGVDGLSREAGVQLDAFAAVGAMLDIANARANVLDELAARRAERAVPQDRRAA
jgi:hypothetical protein